MKLFHHITDEDECLDSYRIFGVTLMEKATIRYNRMPHSNKALSKVYKRFLGRIIYKARYYNVNGLYKKEFSILSIPIFGTLKLNGYKLLFILGVKVYSKPLKFLSDFKTECVDNLDKRYDDIYIILQHLGDAFRILTVIKLLINKNHSSNPLIMIFSESVIDLIRMMRIDIPYVYIKTNKPFKQRMETQFSKDEFNLEGFRFFLLWNKWSWKKRFNPIFKQLPNDAHSFFLEAFAYNLTYNKNETGKLETIPEAECNMLEKSKQAGLNLDNFVLLAPESFAYNMFYESFWEDLIKVLQSLGYDVYVNIVAGKGILEKNSYTNDKSKEVTFENVQNIKSFYLTVAEVFSLACKAKKIICQRSGLSELLVQADVPMCVLYSGKDKNTVEMLKTVYSLSNSPFSKSEIIHEINVVEMYPKDCVKIVTEMLNLK